ncbi:MAG TPA: RDD family protein, partial [Methylomirabilota bacterium]|nr:RDD family protein [Methylomirabilota bacterium]
MNCQNCDAPVLASDVTCQKCGARLLHRRTFPPSPRQDLFVLTAEESPSDLQESSREDNDWQFPPRPVAAPSSGPAAKAAAAEVRWGGFFRRAGACIIDLVMLASLAALMGAMAYVGYKVGLAAHNRPISWSRAVPLLSYLTFAWIGLSTAYFVIFHGMEGKTVGKWLLGLRVVGEGQSPIGYRRALLR